MRRPMHNLPEWLWTTYRFSPTSDARPDAALGRIYLPRDEMAERGVDEAAVLALQCTPAYRGLVAHTLEAE